MAYRILFIEHMAGIGGGQVYLIELLKKLDRARFEPVVTLVSPGELRDRVAAAGAKTEILDIRRIRHRHPGVALGSLVRLLKVIRKHHIDLIHVNSQKALLFALPAGLISRTPVVWHCHVDRDFGKVYDVIGSLFSSVIVTNSNYVSGRFDRVPLAGRKLRLVHNGIDTANIRPRDGCRIRKELGIPEGRLVVGTFGRLQEEKGMRYFVEAAPLVAARVPEADFLIVGGTFDPGDTYQDCLRSMAEASGISSRITFAGFRSDIIDCVAAMDIVVIPSLREGLPLAVAEAMALEKPIVATSVGGIPEMIEDGKNGLLVRPRDGRMIADQVVKLAGDPALRSELGKAARVVAKAKFDLDVHVEKIQGIYEEVLG